MVAVIWTDWYAYHLARMRALTNNCDLRGNVLGIELVGGCGEHRGLRFRSDDREDLPVVTLLPRANWSNSLQPRLPARSCGEHLDATPIRPWCSCRDITRCPPFLRHYGRSCTAAAA